MTTDRDADQINNIQRILEQERIRRLAIEAKLNEALTLLHKTLKDREKFRNLIEDINAIIFATDQHGVIVYISPIIQVYTGYRPALSQPPAGDNVMRAKVLRRLESGHGGLERPSPHAPLDEVHIVKPFGI